MIITIKRKTFDNNRKSSSNNSSNNRNQRRRNNRNQSNFRNVLKNWEEKDLLGVYKNGLLYGGLGLAGVAGLGTAYYLIDKANKEGRKRLGKYYIDESLGLGGDLSNE